MNNLDDLPKRDQENHVHDTIAKTAFEARNRQVWFCSGTVHLAT